MTGARVGRWAVVAGLLVGCTYQVPPLDEESGAAGVAGVAGGSAGLGGESAGGGQPSVAGSAGLGGESAGGGQPSVAGSAGLGGESAGGGQPSVAGSAGLGGESAGGGGEAGLPPVEQPVPTQLIQPLPVCPPSATYHARITVNLDSRSWALGMPWDVANPFNASDFSVTFGAYDSRGKIHPLDTYFVKTGPGSWDYHQMIAAADSASTPIPVGAENVEIGQGTLSFDSDGALLAVTGQPAMPQFVGADPTQTITTTFGTPIAAGGDGLDGTTSFASPDNASSLAQDGYSAQLASTCPGLKPTTLPPILPATVPVVPPPPGGDGSPCAPWPTEVLQVQANLNERLPLQSEEWDPQAPAGSSVGGVSILSESFTCLACTFSTRLRGSGAIECWLLVRNSGLHPQRFRSKLPQGSCCSTPRGG
jgi:hypothetical protein